MLHAEVGIRSIYFPSSSITPCLESLGPEIQTLGQNTVLNCVPGKCSLNIRVFRLVVRPQKNFKMKFPSQTLIQGSKINTPLLQSRICHVHNCTIQIERSLIFLSVLKVDVMIQIDFAGIAIDTGYIRCISIKIHNVHTKTPTNIPTMVARGFFSADFK